MDDEKLVLFNRYFDFVGAALAKAQLDEANIPCFLENEQVATQLGMINPTGGIRLMVPQSLLERAKKVQQEQVTVDDAELTAAALADSTEVNDSNDDAGSENPPS